MNAQKFLTSLFGLFVMVAPLCAGAASWIPESQWQGVLDRTARRLNLSGASAISRNGRILATGAYGLANEATGEKNTTQTLFRVGSVSKQFAAAAILQLEEKGLLSVNDPLEKYFPDFPAPLLKITLHQLLSNTSGIQDYAHEGHDDTYPHTRKEMLELFFRKPLLFKPGSRYGYSSGNFFILGYLVEKLSGETYGDYLKNHIFDVAGMPSSRLDWPKSLPSGFALGYMPNFGGSYPAPFVDSSFAFAAGAIGSTVSDLAAWATALADGKIINRTSMKKMGTVYGAGSNYGYAFWISDKQGRRLWAHGGRISGFCADVRIFVEEGIALATLGNIEMRIPENVDDEVVDALLN